MPNFFCTLPFSQPSWNTLSTNILLFTFPTEHLPQTSRRERDNTRHNLALIRPHLALQCFTVHCLQHYTSYACPLVFYGSCLDVISSSYIIYFTLLHPKSKCCFAFVNTHFYGSHTTCTLSNEYFILHCTTIDQNIKLRIVNTKYADAWMTDRQMDKRGTDRRMADRRTDGRQTDSGQTDG